MSTNEKPLHVAQAEGLRALADMIEQNPEFARSANSYLKSLNVWHTTDAETLEALARAALRSGAKVEKEYYADTFAATFTWGVVGAAALSPRESVCERVVTGIVTVTKSVPDPEKLAAVPTVEITETVEKTEWRCRPLLAAEKDAAVTA